MADNYLEKKMEEFKNRPMNSNNNKKAGNSLNKLLTRNRSYSQFDSKVIVRMEHLKSITDVCGKIEFIGGMKAEEFSFEYVINNDNLYDNTSEFSSAISKVNNASIVVKVNKNINNQLSSTTEESTREYTNATSIESYANLKFINLGILLQSMLLRATEMGLNGKCEKIIETDNSSGNEIEVTIAIGKGYDSSK